MNQYIELKQTFFSYNRGKLTGEQFMRYVHNNKWVEYILNLKDYKTLIQYDIKEFNGREKIKTLFFNYYDSKEYDRIFIILTLSSMLKNLNDFDSIRYALTIIQNIYLAGNKELMAFVNKYQPPKLYEVMREEDKQIIYQYLPRLVFDTKELIHELSIENR